MAPADLRKEGSSFTTCLWQWGLWLRENKFEERIKEYVIMGELSLDGNVMPIKGALPIAIKARAWDLKVLYPKENAKEAAVVNNLDVYGVENIKEVIRF